MYTRVLEVITEPATPHQTAKATAEVQINKYQVSAAENVRMG